MNLNDGVATNLPDTSPEYTWPESMASFITARTRRFIPTAANNNQEN